jgi:hypothetical protein
VIELISLDFEDIRISNDAFVKLKMIEFSLMYFAIIQIGVSIVLTEMNYYYPT